eukprot:m.128967 g.128967  ORF g.128967 m.128967 type:complete len:495 (-) comp14569_c0_seq1:162-1646(-)
MKQIKSCNNLNPAVITFNMMQGVIHTQLLLDLESGSKQTQKQTPRGLSAVIMVLVVGLRREVVQKLQSHQRKKKADEPLPSPPAKKKAATKPSAPATVPTPVAVAKKTGPSKHGGKVISTGWESAEDGDCSVRAINSPSCSKIAGFDMDWTVIRTKSGKTFPKGKDDWMLWDPKVPAKMQELHNDGYKIALFTNQGGIAKGKHSLKEIQGKIENIQKAIGVPLLAVIMYGKDLYRKPCTGAWDMVEHHYNGGVAVDRSQCLFVGDGAGRKPPVVKKKDFGDSDLKFALNLNVKFQTPEECYLGQSQKYGIEDFDPRTLGDSVLPYPIKPSGSQECIIVVGAPGSGKSNIARKHFPDYTRINRDTLKTAAKCQAAAKAALAEGKSIIVDNQNAKESDRAPYLAAAKANGVPCRFVRIDVPKDFCFHLNEFRSLCSESKEHRGVDRVPSMVIHMFFKNVQEPTKKEGFAGGVTVGIDHFELDNTNPNLPLLKSFLL